MCCCSSRCLRPVRAALGYVFLWPRHSGDGTVASQRKRAFAAGSRGPNGSSTRLKRLVWISCTSTECPVVSTTPSTWAPEWRCSTTTMTAISTSSSLRVGCWAQERLSVRHSSHRKTARPPKGRLFRNDLEVRADGTRTLRFTDVTEASGSNATGYGMGVTTGDYDNDGCVDLYVTTLGRNQMFRNSCDGTFTDVSKPSRHRRQRMERVSAAFVDYDRDGWLDLFVGHYLNYSTDANIAVLQRGGQAGLLPAARLFSPAQPPLSQQPQRHVHRRDGGGGPVA